MCRWIAYQYTAPLRGKAYLDLIASVRGRMSTPCRGPDVMRFWQAMGLTQRHQCLKRGYVLDLELGGQKLQVRRTRVPWVR